MKRKKKNAPGAAERERLIHLIEEAAEVQQAASKVLRFGWNTTGKVKEAQRSGQQYLQDEIGDLVGAIRLLSSNDGLDLAEIGVAASRKIEKFRSYSKHNKRANRK